MNLYSFITIASLVALTSCVSIQRDIYFKDKNTLQEKTWVASAPGAYLITRPILVKDQYPRQISLHVNNSENVTYFMGILIPIIPVFFLPGSKYSLDEKQPLQIKCSITFDQSDPRFIRKVNAKWTPDYYVATPVALTTTESIRQLGNDLCTDLFITRPNGEVLKPVTTSVDPRTKDNLFSFDVAAASLKEFSIHLTKIQLNTGTPQKVDISYDIIFEDWTRFRYIEKFD